MFPDEDVKEIEYQYIHFFFLCLPPNLIFYIYECNKA